MSVVNAAEANRSFSKLLRQVSEGESITVLSHGRPVAMLSPVSNQGRDRELSRQSLLKRLRLQPTREEHHNWTRDELYD